MKSISNGQESLMTESHSAPGQQCGPTSEDVSPLRSKGPAFDTWGDSPYSTKTQWADSRNGRPADKSFYGSFLHLRDVSLQLSWQYRASVSNRLVSKYATTERQRPTAKYRAVGLLFLGNQIFDPELNKVCFRLKAAKPQRS